MWSSLKTTSNPSMGVAVRVGGSLAAGINISRTSPVDTLSDLVTTFPDLLISPDSMRSTMTERLRPNMRASAASTLS